MNKIAYAPWLALSSVLVLLTACGGGGGSSAPAVTPTPAADVGTVNVQITDGPGDEYDHVWVTIKSIAFHTDANQVWNAKDATWKTYTLPAPVTLDLANLTNGALNAVFANLQLPSGSYKQIRLFMAGFDDTLSASAQSSGLIYNDQVDYTDDVGTAHHVPLEIAYPTQGMQLNGTFNVTAGSTLNLAVDFDLEHDLVRFIHGDAGAQEYYFTMKPNLRYFDLSQAGAIIGKIDPAVLCSGTNRTGCGYNFVVKAETLTPDGTRHYDLRATTVKADGSFTLFPVPAGQTYDVLIRGRNVETSLIKGVTVAAGSTAASGAAALSTGVITPTLDATGEYFAQFSGPMAPTSGWALFQQTLPGAGEVPYEVRWANTNPYSGLLMRPEALANGPLHVANYVAGGAPVFSAVVPQEGGGGYSVAGNGLGYYMLSANALLTSPGSNTVASPVLFAAPTPALSSKVVAGTVSGNIQQLTAGTYDKGYLVISRFANIVDTVDISGILTANQGAGGAYSVTLPAGSSTAAVPGAYYYAYLRVWNSAHPKKTTKVVPVDGFIDLRSSASASGINVSF